MATETGPFWAKVARSVSDPLATLAYEEMVAAELDGLYWHLPWEALYGYEASVSIPLF